ncbi:MAG: hypothetical protein JOY62_10340 [Acidobacteriaceae bacterium]|nr:hypothetical protein [Acidobacteriaceae bacterium]MBV9780358.1 hypothetical protein [Acidobacteriaceae bacterium]
MTLIVAALVLPSLFWDKGAETANLLDRARISHIDTPASIADSWKRVAGITVDVVDLKQLIHLTTPSVRFDPQEASATRAAWVNSNGWRFLRDPDARFYYEAPGASAPLAAAEAFTYGVWAVIHTNEAGLQPLGGMLAFLKQLDSEYLPALANIGFIDDGSPQSGEFMNLLVRRNLLFKIVKQPDPKLDLTVALGSPDYPRFEAGNPSLLAEKVRSHLTDEKRLLRIYGSEEVIGRLFGDGNHARLYLINYESARASIEGIRVRVLGDYSKQQITGYELPDARLLDVSTGAGATEFTIPELRTFAVITLSQRK